MLEKSPSLAADYRSLWSNACYRRYSPGLHCIDETLEILRPPMGASFIDFGCGSGKPAAELRKRSYGVVGIDFADNCLDDDIDIPFLVADLAKPLNLSAQYGFCTDVLEHIAPDSIDDVLLSICDTVKKAIVFSIALDADEFGPLLLGKPLHLTIQKADWWKAKLESFWPRVEIVSESETQLAVACFTFPDKFRHDVKVEALCNTPDQVIRSHIETNGKRGLPFVEIGAATGREIVIVGGGPSLAKTLPFIAGMKNAGYLIVALNNAANFLKENGIRADWQMLIDCRPENIKFVRDFPAAGYLLSAQCHPLVFDHLARQNVRIFYPAMEGIRDLLARETDTAPLILGMHTSGLQALSVCYTMGYRTMHLHGYDSSDAASGDSHAYNQDETAAEQKRLDVRFNGKHYRCSFAMYKQAEEFEKYSRMLADHGAVIHVYGDGLLPAIARDMSARAEAEDTALPPDASCACYDLAAAPASYDFLCWLVIAEMARLRANAPAPLKVGFRAGPDDGFRRDDGLPLLDRQLMLANVMRPALKLLGAIEHPDGLEGGSWHSRYVLAPIVESYRNGETVPRFCVPDDYRDEARAWLKQHAIDGPPVTITLREASHWPERNSNVAAWLEFARSLDRRVVFVRDTEMADEPLDGMLSCPRASRDLLFRAALYDGAFCNCFIANGPGGLALFGRAPWLYFMPEVAGYAPSTDAWLRKYMGFGRGEQVPWARPDQRIIWEADSYLAIRTAWDALRPHIREISNGL